MSNFILKVLFIFATLFFYSLHLSSQLTSKRDTLVHEVKIAKGEKKLELLIELINESSGLELLNNAYALEQEAIKQKNMRYLAASEVVKSHYFWKNNNLDSTVYYSELANRIYAEHGVKNTNQSYLYMGRIYLFNGYYELAIKNLKLYFEGNNTNYSFFDYAVLAEAYLVANNYKMAKEVLFEAIELIESEPNPPSLFKAWILYHYLMVAYVNNQEYGKALELSLSLYDKIDKEKGEIPEHYISQMKMHNHNFMATIYIGLGKASEAKLYLDRIEQIPHVDNFESFYETFHGTWGEYYLLKKDYRKALYYIDKSLNYFANEQPQKFLEENIINLKIKALEGIGRYEEALNVLKDWTRYKDSINQKNIPLQISQISKEYELHKIRTSVERKRADLEKSRIINIGLATVLILFGTILFLIIKNNKKIKEKNKNLVKQYTELEKYANQGKGLFVLRDENEEVNSKDLQLFKRIEEYIADTSVFKNPYLTREILAEQLATNRTYLTEAIKQGSGKTFLEYINYYRLEYARSQLISNGSIPVNQIMYDSGFSSSSTFYKLFKERYDMSPNELRQAKYDLEKDSSTKQAKVQVGDSDA